MASRPNHVQRWRPFASRDACRPPPPPWRARVHHLQSRAGRLRHGTWPYYGSHTPTIAQHPSENNARMMVRLLASCPRGKRDPWRSPAAWTNPG
ncbi:YaeQ family protein [Cupriavidus basilensis]